MNLLKSVFFIFAISIFLGCDKYEVIENDNFTIEFGSECGWCAGLEHITLTATKIKYLRNIPCGENKGITQKSREISEEEWNEIISSFDYALFKTLEYNDCNVCADGCDEIIRITENKNAHDLRYSVSEEIEGIQNLQQILTSLLEEMRESD